MRDHLQAIITVLTLINPLMLRHDNRAPTAPWPAAEARAGVIPGSAR